MTTIEATLVKGLFKTDVFKFSFFNFIVDLWNSLPLDFRTFEHFSSFKNTIDKFYLNKFNVNKDRFFIIFYVHIKYICLDSHMQSTLSLRKDQHFFLCLRTLTGKRWLMTWKNLKGESVLSFSSMEETLKTTHIRVQWMIDFQPLHQLLNGSLQNPFFWRQKYSSTMWRMTSSSLPIFRFFFQSYQRRKVSFKVS